jgi:hypothetical protein
LSQIAGSESKIQKELVDDVAHISGSEFLIQGRGI